MTIILPAAIAAIDYRVAELDYVNEHVAKLLLLPTGARHVQYRAGQYLSLELADGQQRSYSPATPMAASGAIELHVRLYANGRFSRLLRDGLATLGVLKVRGPYGDCLWRSPASATAPILLLATGTGIAPVKALLLAALANGCTNPIWLYWGARHASDLYAQPLFEALEQQYANVHFVGVTSPRHVQDCAAQMHPDLTDASVYACGHPGMVDAAYTLLTRQHGLAAERFLADSFEPANALLPASPSVDGVTVQATFSAAHLPNAAHGRLHGASGSSLLAALRAAGVLKGVCGGRQSCGTCRVSLTADGYALAPAPARGEQRLLQALPNVGALDRLACQIILEPTLDGLHFNIPALAV